MSRSLVWGASRGTKLARKLQKDMSAWSKNARKKREVRGDEGKMLENCGKKGDKRREGRRERGEKKKNWRKKEKREVKRRRKVERREEERREGWEAQRAEGLLRLKWRRDGTTSCNLEGALCCVVLQDRTFDSQHETSLRHLFLPGRSYEAGPPTLTAHSSHHCPQLLENTAKNNKKRQFGIH